MKYELNIPKVELDPKSKEMRDVCMGMFHNLATGKITGEQLSLEMATVSLKKSDNLKYKPFRKETPRDLMNYYSTPAKDRQATAGFWQRTDIKEYLEAKKRNASDNVSNFHWLGAMSEIFEKAGDTTSANACTLVLRTYPKED